MVAGAGAADVHSPALTALLRCPECGGEVRAWSRCGHVRGESPLSGRRGHSGVRRRGAACHGSPVRRPAQVLRRRVQRVRALRARELAQELPRAALLTPPDRGFRAARRCRSRRVGLHRRRGGARRSGRDRLRPVARSAAEGAAVRRRAGSRREDALGLLLRGKAAARIGRVRDGARRRRNRARSERRRCVRASSRGSSVPTGRAWITVPHALRHIALPFRLPNRLHDRRLGHLRRYDAGTLVEAARRAGLEVEEVQFTGHSIKVLQLVAARNERFWWWCERRDLARSQQPRGSMQLSAVFKRA